MDERKKDARTANKVPGAKGRVKRSEAIRQHLRRIGTKAKPHEVVAALAAKGIKVAPEQVIAVREKYVAISKAKKGPATRRIVNFLDRRRVPISVLIFAILMIEDIVMGIKPHDIANPTDLNSILGLSLVFGGLSVRLGPQAHFVNESN